MQPLLLGLALAPPLLAVWTYFHHSMLTHRLGGFLVLYGLLAMAFLTAKINKIPLQRPRTSTIAAGIGLFAVSLASMSGVSLDREVAGIYLLRNMVLLLFVWVVFSLYVDRTSAQRNALFLALLAGNTLMLLVMLAVIAAHAGDPEYQWREFWAGVTHTRHIGYFTTFQVAMAAALLSISSVRSERIIFALCLLLGFTMANIAGGRTSIVAGLVAAIACALIANPERRRANALIVLALFAVSIPLSTIHVPPHHLWGIQRLIDTASGKAVSGGFVGSRDLLWARALDRIHEHPWIGWGEGQFHFLQRGIWMAKHPHNIVLQSLVSYGMIGSAAILALVWTSIFASLKAVWRHPQAHIVPLAIILGLALLSLTDGPLFYLGPLQVFALACVMARIAGLQDRAHQPITTEPER